MAVTPCSEKEARVVEELMRREIFHSTLDWPTAEEFEAGARAAFQALKVMRANGALPDSYRKMLKRRWPTSETPQNHGRRRPR